MIMKVPYDDGAGGGRKGGGRKHEENPGDMRDTTKHMSICVTAKERKESEKNTSRNYD